MGSPGADGNTLGVRMPPTERVDNLKKVENLLLRSSCLRGPLTWEEFLRGIFTKQYPNDPAQLDRAVRVSASRVRQGYLPTCVMDEYREAERFHEVSRLK